MHPVLFELPGLNLPVRMFGLFVIDAFFVSVLWTQWRLAVRADSGLGEGGPLAARFRWWPIALFGGRVIWIALPFGWSATVVGVLATDLLLAIFLWYGLRGALKGRKEAAAEAELIFNLAFWLLLVGLLGARFFHVVTTEAGRKAFVENPLLGLVGIWDGGIVWYGGLISSAAFGAWYLWWRDRKILELGDVIMVGVALALFVGRWACLAAGDDYGRETDVAWGIVFPVHPHSEIPRHWQGEAVLHPVQLYMSLHAFLLFLAGVWLLGRKAFPGLVLWSTFLLYAVGRFLTESFRGDEDRGLYDVTSNWTLSSSQLISVAVFFVAGFALLITWRRSRRRDSATPPDGDTG